MTIFTGIGDHGEFLGIGLSRRNVEKLLAGQPIVIDLSELNMSWKGKVFIVGGETEIDMIEDLTNLGFLKGVRVICDPKL